MKKGDKIICKKTVTTSDPFSDLPMVHYIKGKSYEVVGYNDNFSGEYVLKSEKCDTSNVPANYIWNYFYTKSELRKLKLESLKK